MHESHASHFQALLGIRRSEKMAELCNVQGEQVFQAIQKHFHGKLAHDIVHALICKSMALNRELHTP